ncbi:hypothetical protein ACEPAG_1348 [Sanghuangporus baumii]
MKFDENTFLPLFIPLLNLASNGSETGFAPRVSSTANSTTSGIYSPGGTPTVGPQPLFTYSSHQHGYGHDERNENRFASIGEGEHGMRRPRAGQKTCRVETRTKLKESDECPDPPILSCSAKADETDSCCVVRPGGVLVHTQFWDLDFGVADAWGIHGLWPDKCNGQFYENCDSGRKYSGSQIETVLQNAEQNDLLDYMRTFWVSNDESPENFWAHEWATHGTCVSTLEPNCFEGYVTAQEVVPYFETVVQLFQQLNTYDALTNAGISPSSTETYTLTELQDVVSTSLGYVPDFICSNARLSSVQFYLNTQGPLQDGRIVASHASRKSECPNSGIYWLPKTVGK